MSDKKNTKLFDILWNLVMTDKSGQNLYNLVEFGRENGFDNSQRIKIWPFLLGIDQSKLESSKDYREWASNITNHYINDNNNNFFFNN